MTLQKVAKLAGVSTSTVSRVVNNHPSVAPETSRLVRQAMDEASFSPSIRRRKRGPAEGDSRAATTVGLLFSGRGSSSAGPGTERLIRGISSAATSHGINLSIRFVKARGGAAKPSDFAGLQGVLIQGATPDDHLRGLLQSLPTVWLMANQGRPQWGDQVLPDSAAIGQLAANYLMDRGHTRLVACSLDWNSWAMEVRARAFMHAAEDRGADAQLLLPPNGPVGATVEESAQVLARRIASLDTPATGIFVAEDRQVAPIYEALSGFGISPKNGCRVEAISCNRELVHLMPLANPPATIDICFEMIGRRGIELLMARMQQRSNADRLRVLIEPRLIDNIFETIRPDQGTPDSGESSLQFPS